MILTNEIRGRIKAKSYTHEQVAKMLNISPKTFSLKLQKGKFASDEIEKLIVILDIKNPIDIFFAKEVT